MLVFEWEPGINKLNINKVCISCQLGDPVVRQIQTAFNLRYDVGLTVDGIFGPATKAALIRGLQGGFNTLFGRNLALT
ncbi:MAG: hypothetical protein FWG30_08660 [Eubacteriaceae bacterium]|nr:hypothetical protein [Eubacteriaceae bacterium]